jgi:hypothetical protein
MEVTAKKRESQARMGCWSTMENAAEKRATTGIKREKRCELSGT